MKTKNIIKEIINIKNKNSLNNFSINKPIFQSNYLFHYLILLGNSDGLKLTKFPIYIENSDGLNGFHLASKEYNYDILCYLIDNYSDYIYNRNQKKLTFAHYLPVTEFSKLIKKYPNLDWEDLLINGTKIPYQIFSKIILNLKFNELKKFIKIIVEKYPDKFKPKFNNQYLIGIAGSNNINTNQKIELLKDFTDDELNIKLENGQGMILVSINNDDKKLFEYLMKRNIDLDYYSLIDTINPLRMGLVNDILNNTNFYTPKILYSLNSKYKNWDFLKSLDKWANNIVHTLFNVRINRNKQLVSLKEIGNHKIDLDILKHCDDEIWNQKNVNKMTPLDLIINLDFEIYSKILIDNQIKIDKQLIERIENNYKNYDSRWIELFKSLPEYKRPINNINLDEYYHCNIFKASFKDVGIFSLYLSDTYSDLYIPNMKSYMINNLTFDHSMPFSDALIEKESFFPWVINIYSEYEYYIHPYLNNLINTEKNNNKRFAFVFLSLIKDDLLHANALIYDFKNNTVERFEPYGNTNDIDEYIDNILEEELTWSTGLKYLRPKDYMPYSGFQTISDETNIKNTKPGDFGGFCLAWCLLYVETRLKNPNLEPEKLVSKLINKLNNMDIKYSEYIRNYSNKINKFRIKYLQEIDINPKNISNIVMNQKDELKITKYLIDKYNGRYY
jgi:hypothetical protein